MLWKTVMAAALIVAAVAPAQAGKYGNALNDNGKYGNGQFGNALNDNGKYGNGRFGNGRYGNGVETGARTDGVRVITIELLPEARQPEFRTDPPSPDLYPELPQPEFRVDPPDPD